MKPVANLVANRVSSVDAYRGLVMFLMMAEVLELARVAKAIHDGAVWQFLAFHQTHARMVRLFAARPHSAVVHFPRRRGVAVLYRQPPRPRTAAGLDDRRTPPGGRSCWCSLASSCARSADPHTYFTFEDTLSQIGLGYFPLFLLGFTKPKWQWLALAVVLIGYWAAFALYPVAGTGFDYAAVGVSPKWAAAFNFTGFAAHWNKNSNLAWAFDRWFLNLFPARLNPFLFNTGGYATLSFIPTLGTMILGLIAGGWIKGGGTGWNKVGRLTLAGLAGLVLGIAANYFGVCPIVKRIWTPSWVLFSGGWCFLFLAAFYAIMDVMRLQTWAFPLRVIGMNSIAAYCMADLMRSFIIGTLHTHLGVEAFQYWGEAYEPFAIGVVVLTVYWLILFWMYRRGIFLRI